MKQGTNNLEMMKNEQYNQTKMMINNSMNHRTSIGHQTSKGKKEWKMKNVLQNVYVFAVHALSTEW